MSVVIRVGVGLGKHWLDVAFHHRLDAFDDGGDPHTTSDAECDQRVAAARAVEFVDGVSDQHGAGRAERMAHGDGSTIDVEFFVGNLELALCAEDDGCKGFVNFPHIDIVGGEPRFMECSTCSRCGAVSMIVGSTPVVAVATTRARGVSPMSVPACSVPMSVMAAPSTMPEELPA